LNAVVTAARAMPWYLVEIRVVTPGNVVCEMSQDGIDVPRLNGIVDRVNGRHVAHAAPFRSGSLGPLG
jgi:hypothetical protein